MALWRALGDDAEQRFVGVDPVRAFPISDPNHWISFTDDQGSEVFCLRSLDGLAPESRRLLEQEAA